MLGDDGGEDGLQAMSSFWFLTYGLFSFHAQHKQAESIPTCSTTCSSSRTACQSTALAYMVLENYFIAMCSPKGISWFSSWYLYQLHRSRYTNIKCSTGFWWHPCQTASYYTPCRVCMLLVLVTRERCDGRRRMRGDEQWTNLRYAHMGRNGAECMCLYGEWYFRQFTFPLPKASDDLLFPMCLFAASEVCSLFVVSVIEGRQKHCQTTVKLCIIWLQHLACILFLVGLVTPWSPPVLPFPWFWL